MPAWPGPKSDQEDVASLRLPAGSSSSATRGKEGAGVSRRRRRHGTAARAGCSRTPASSVAPTASADSVGTAGASSWPVAEHPLPRLLSREGQRLAVSRHLGLQLADASTPRGSRSRCSASVARRQPVAAGLGQVPEVRGTRPWRTVVQPDQRGAVRPRERQLASTSGTPAARPPPRSPTGRPRTVNRTPTSW